MLLNRTFWILVIALGISVVLFTFVVPSGRSDLKGASKSSHDSYAQELSKAWDKMADKYGAREPVSFDPFVPALFGIVGFAVVFGTNFWMKRRNRDAIERFFSHFKDKR
jgi:hypothetical protein